MVRFSCIFIFMCILSCNSTRNGPGREKDIDSTNLRVLKNKSAPVTEKSILMFKEQDIRAAGNEPFWMLEIKNDSLQFRLLGKSEFSKPLPSPVVNTMDSVAYQLQLHDTLLTVSFKNKKCADNMSGFESPFIARVIFKIGDLSTEYKGCADYLSAFSKPRELPQ